LAQSIEHMTEIWQLIFWCAARLLASGVRSLLLFSKQANDVIEIWLTDSKSGPPDRIGNPSSPGYAVPCALKAINIGHIRSFECLINDARLGAGQAGALHRAAPAVEDHPEAQDARHAQHCSGRFQYLLSSDRNSDQCVPVGLLCDRVWPHRLYR